MTRELVIQKSLGLAIVALAVYYLSPLQVGLAFSIFGQGHFLGAYYYQWKAGKMTMTWVAAFVTLTTALFTLAILTDQVAWFALVASVVFFIHHFQDEVTLFGKERSLSRALEQLPPVLLFTALISRYMLGATFSSSLVMLAIVLLVPYVASIAIGTYRPDALSAYLLLITAGLFALWFFDIQVSSTKLTGSVILLHYVCWYVHFYFRFGSKPDRQSAYVKDMLAIHAIVFALYALFAYTAWGSIVLAYVFPPLFFYIWAILHIVFSIRLADYRGSLRW
ncbi:MAG: hypothetical protein G01um10148_346 [Parcubacteria group bacterium Gr01-1014_8]|nr:MAG: hypothetical protein G01um10148_346 [Parcubacteria group bacterium Gr01-1014_8]